MNCNILSDEVKEIFISDYADLSEIMTEYKFSFRYRRKRRKIISFYSLQIRPEREKLPRRVKLAVIFSMIIFAILIAGFVTYTYISGFYVDKHNEYALLTIDESSGSNIINEKFYLDMDLSDYEAEVICDIPTVYSVKYSRGKDRIVISQTVLSQFGEMRVDNEGNIIDISFVGIDGVDGLQLQNRDKQIQISFSAHGYIFTFKSTFDEKTTKDMVKSTKLEYN